MGSGRTAVNILSISALNLVLAVLLFAPLRAHASVFDTIKSWLGVKQEVAESVPNSQNMALLQASLSPDPSATSSQDIKIVEGTSLLSDAQISPADKGTADRSISQDQISLYVVRDGDSLPAIAKMFGVTTNTIAWANNLKGNKISVGQTLVILPISGVEHTVKSGDTIKSIAAKYKGDADEILQYNNLSKGAKLAVGDIIIVPDGEMSASVSTPSKKSSSGSGNDSSTPSSTPYPVYEGYYMRPIVGGVKTQGLHGHNGVDLASSYGTNILAAAEGTVLISRDSGWNGGYGDYIVIAHPNGTQTLYGHLSSTAVSAGDHVEQGQVIGHMGSTGSSTGVHLHFEVRGGKNPF
jgi:murein DD-endopeptidase MepM/ murein hydrolase activator NlpD